MSNKILNTYKSPNFTPIKRSRIDMIVLHCTVGSLSPSLNWLCDPKSKASAHYLISKFGDIFNLVDVQYSAWHAGESEWEKEKNVNKFSIGIELENDNKGELYPIEQLEALSDLCSQLIMIHDIPYDRIVGHKDVAPKRKTDPFRFPWCLFSDMLKNKKGETWQMEQRAGKHQNSISQSQPMSQRFWARLLRFFRRK